MLLCTLAAIQAIAKLPVNSGDLDLLLSPDQDCSGQDTGSQVEGSSSSAECAAEEGEEGNSSEQ